MSAPDSARPDAAPRERDDGLAPDPAFWGADDRAARRRSTRRTGQGSPTGAFGARSDRRAVVAIAAVLAVTAALVSLRAATPTSRPAAGTGATTAPTRGSGGRVVVVHVAGAVSRPGVVQLPASDRVVDALDATGGALANADLDRLNLAARLRDGEQVLVPTSVPSTSTTTSPTVSIPSTGAPG